MSYNIDFNENNYDIEKFLDISYKSINKYSEELCGDKVEFINNDDNCIIVLSDGLGSGVKANILATMTTKIAATMLKNGASIYDTIETIINTLPECKVRKLAYSTFTIIQINKNNNVYDAYIAEYDSPPYFYYSHNRSFPIDKKERIIGSKKIYESDIHLELGDTICVVSDGAIHAGIGQMLNLVWSWDEINKYLKNLNDVNNASQTMNGNFIAVCNNLYNDKPGDDTTILTIKVRKPEYTDVFIGPPSHESFEAF